MKKTILDWKFMSYVLYFLFPCHYFLINTVTEYERFIFPLFPILFNYWNYPLSYWKKIFSPIIRRIHVDYFKPRHEAVRILAHIMFPHVNVQIELAMIWMMWARQPISKTSTDPCFDTFLRSFINVLRFRYFSLLIIFRIFYPWIQMFVEFGNKHKTHFIHT